MVRNYFLIILIFVLLTGCIITNEIASAFQGQAISKNILVDDLNSIFLNKEGINKSGALDADEKYAEFANQIDYIENEFNKMLTYYQENNGDIKSNKEIINSLKLIENLTNINDYFDESINDLYLKHGGKFAVIGSANSSFQTEIELIDYFYERYPEVKKTFNAISHLISESKKLAKDIYINSMAKERDILEHYAKNKFGKYLLYKLSSVQGVNDLHHASLSNTVSENRIYRLGRNYEVLQSVSSGSLITASDPYGSSTFFLETDNIFVDGYKFSFKDMVFIDGIFEYNSLVGMKRVYRLILIEPDIDFYFIQ